MWMRCILGGWRLRRIGPKGMVGQLLMFLLLKWISNAFWVDGIDVVCWSEENNDLN
jgi:hypothetical protein